LVADPVWVQTYEVFFLFWDVLLVRLVQRRLRAAREDLRRAIREQMPPKADYPATADPQPPEGKPPPADSAA
jgi:hypothetical protein